ncbi:MAG: hypothetical protein NUV56_02950 [Candidatus Uhrbacteria bacterium]|nr:hypothetical protein [Candidatus Uhrbacteria bacterium]
MFFTLLACNAPVSTTIAITPTFMEQDVECGVRLNDDIITSTGKEVTTDPGTYIVTVGDDNLSGDGVPLCTSGNDSLVRPPLTVVLSEGEVAEVSAPTNLYIDGTWTCQNELGEQVTEEVRYLGGQFLSMPGVMLDMMVEGRTVRYNDSALSISGMLRSNSADFDLMNAAEDHWSIACERGSPL